MGQAESMYMLGLCYEYGHGTPINGQQAYTWLEAARVHGIRAAQIELEKDLLSLAPQDSIPTQSMELSAYPNPFSETLTLSFTLSKPSPVTISLSSLSLNQNQPYRQTTEQLFAGAHHITITPTNITPGMYIIQIHTNETKISSTVFKQ